MLCPRFVVTHNTKEPCMVIKDQKRRTETPIERRRNMKCYFCMPRLRGSGSSSRKSRRLITPMSLLDRFREAVFRLIMLSALSKATAVHENRTSAAGSGHIHPHHNHKSYYSYDPHHSEAVADCIEFLKKSATADENRDSTASNSSTDGAPARGSHTPACNAIDYTICHNPEHLIDTINF